MKLLGRGGIYLAIESEELIFTFSGLGLFLSTKNLALVELSPCSFRQIARAAVVYFQCLIEKCSMQKVLASLSPYVQIIDAL